MSRGSIEPLKCNRSSVSVRVAACAAARPADDATAAAPTADAALISEAWAELCSANPRLHDGQILTVQGFDGATGTFTAARQQYRDLATQGHTLSGGPHKGTVVADLGIRLLGIKAFITAAGSDGQDHALILRRSPDVRIYGNMWEIGPGGGIDVPERWRDKSDASPGRSSPAFSMKWLDLLGALIHEALEELALNIPKLCKLPSLHGVYQDHQARSYDIVAHCRWNTTIDPKAGWCNLGERDWEYNDVAWLSRADAASWATGAKLVSPVARVVLKEWAGVPAD